MSRPHVVVERLSEGFHNVSINTQLVLTRDEVTRLADLLMDLACDDVAGDLYSWLDEHPEDPRKRDDEEDI